MIKKGRPRLKDIAEKTGFSINTVSVALRGGEKVPRATRKRIIAAAAEMDYLPNALARSLSSKNSRTVGVILNNIVNPILTYCAQLIEAQLEARGYRMMLIATDGNIEREKAAIDALREHQVEGILIYPTNQMQVDHIVGLRARGFPIVMLSGVSNKGVDLVSIDDRIGTFKLTSHLLALGHSRIAFIDVGQSAGNFRKVAGYREAHEAFGLPFQRDLVFCPAGANTASCGYRSAGRVNEIYPRVTAIIASSDPIAIGVMGWCRDNNVKIPSQMSLAGFDDIEFAAYLDVPLTTVGYSAQGVSAQSVSRLLTLMESEEVLPDAITVLIEPELIVRSSASHIRLVPDAAVASGGAA